MKLLAKPVVFISALFIFIIAAACKKDSDKAIVIEGFKLKDYSGNDIGYYGAVDNDWTFKNTLSDREMALFDFMPADVNLNNTVEAAISGNSVFAYPNPFAYSQNYFASASDSVVMKVVVVNDKLNVLTKTALKGKGGLKLAIDYYSDTLLYPNKSSLRMYYSFSAQNKPNYKAGYGDLKICRVSIPWNSINTCFP
jgi:hypothetical protein